jgi:hypothetical protein
MAKAKARRGGNRVLFKVLFGRNGRAIGVETAEEHRVAPRPLATVRPTVKSIEVPLEVIQGRLKGMAVCYVHIRCRVFAVPCS